MRIVPSRPSRGKHFARNALGRTPNAARSARQPARRHYKTHKMFVSIDPGVTTGWALWNLRGLVACGLGDPRVCPRHVVVPRADDEDVIHDVWIESQRIYPHSHADPNDILKLAQDAGRWAGIYAAVGVEAFYVEPSTWKGQVPKAIHHPRIWGALTAPEQAIVASAGKGVAPSKRHNMMDAVGIGLWVRNRRKGAR